MNAGKAPKFVSYLRVSTTKQGRSGLGLDAQREAVANYLAGLSSAKLIAEYVEVESGKTNERPKLAAALHMAKVTGAKLIIAKLDRLSRNVAFIAALQDSHVSFVCADMPEATELTIHILAAVAQHERKMISTRTKAALQVAKRRGKKLGNPNGARALRKAGRGNAAAVKRIKADAEGRAAALATIIGDIRAEGTTTLQGIARELNARGMQTARGGQWHASTVRLLLARGVLM
ncbi:recombinase family protein [Hyphomicrobium sp. B1]|uniref:recombinase family protein n=1 Tax=Hyphomicrobium sp. B1 TaxID=3075651 RepID=UPI003C2AE12C